jgi:hypothetical protein
MTEIDGEWIKRRLDPGKRGQKAALARAAGLTPKQMSYILGGTRAVRQSEAAAIAAFFGETVAVMPEEAFDRPGFEEPPQSYLTPVESLPPNIAGTINATAGRSAYRVGLSEVGFGILQGDTIVLQLGAPAPNGALVVATEVDDYGNANSFIARTAGGFFLRHDPTEPAKRAMNGSTITVMGVIVGLFRDFTPTDPPSE